MKHLLFILTLLCQTAVAAPVFVIDNDNTGSTVPSGSFLQLTASVTANCEYLQVFNSSAKPIFLALGAASSEIKIPYDIPPSANILTEIPVKIRSGVRLSAKAIGADATTGLLIINCIQ